MATLRCTAKFLKKLGLEQPGEPPAARNVLGDWFSNIFYTRQGHFVLLVSEHSLLPVLTTARDLRNLEPRFMRGLEEVLSALHVPANAIEREIELMQPLYYGRTNSRSVLGTMNDFIQSLRFCLAEGRPYSLLEWSLWLAHTPCKPLEWRQPETVAPQLLRNPQGLKVINGGSP